MNDDLVLSRRDVLTFAVAATLTVLVRAHLPAAAALQNGQQALLSTRLATLLAHTESAKVIGGEYLRLYSQEADVNILIDQITSQIVASNVELFGMTDQHLRERLDDMVRADFAADRVVMLRGWVLSPTEARLCALAALL
jgi:hypothetical protein